VQHAGRPLSSSFQIPLHRLQRRVLRRGYTISLPQNGQGAMDDTPLPGGSRCLTNFPFLRPALSMLHSLVSVSPYRPGSRRWDMRRIREKGDSQVLRADHLPVGTGLLLPATC
jgi:hypothetical protein